MGKNWHRLSLRRTLLLVLLPGMLALMVSELWLAWRASIDSANSAYDRSLLGAIKAIDANISTESGGLSVEMPYRMLEFFELTASGKVFYRVATEDRLVEIGNADLPAPPKRLTTGQPQFSDALYFDEPVRVGSYARQLSKPLGTQGDAQRVVIQVAETLGSRQAFIRRLMLQSVQRDLLLIALASVLLTAAIGWALRPLQRLHDEVQARPPDDLAPVDASGIPADVRPLVEAINHHIQRNRRMSEARRRFIDDASHQLRTPLTTLTTQVAYALREPDGARLRDALGAVKLQLDETVRQTNQMLSLARTDAVELTLEPLDLIALATSVTRDWWLAARDSGIDLGLEAHQDRLRIDGHKGLLREALSNLLHNALRYTPRGGSVTVAVRASGGLALVEISDTGTGIPAAEMARAGERFFRASNVQLPGSGLGLAIVASIAQRHGGSMRLSTAAGGQGLAVALVLPLREDSGIP